MEPYFLGQIIAFAGNFAPRYWAFCEGQLLSISSNSDLYSLLGTMYGGDGRSTFGLPDLRGRTAVGAGYGPGLSPVSEGQKGGVEATTLSIQKGEAAKAAAKTVVTDVSPKEIGRSPYLGMRYIIALQGEFPQRS